MQDIIYTVYDAQGNERSSFVVGSSEAGDELTADREARREASKLEAKFGGTYTVVREVVEVE